MNIWGQIQWDHPEHPDGLHSQMLIKKVHWQPHAVTVLTAHPSDIPVPHGMIIESWE